MTKSPYFDPTKQFLIKFGDFVKLQWSSQNIRFLTPGSFYASMKIYAKTIPIYAKKK